MARQNHAHRLKTVLHPVQRRFLAEGDQAAAVAWGLPLVGHIALTRQLNKTVLLCPLVGLVIGVQDGSCAQLHKSPVLLGETPCN